MTAWRPWTREEDTTLRRLHRERASMEVMMAELDRSRNSIESRLRKRSMSPSPDAAFRMPSQQIGSRKNLPRLLAERDERLYGHEPTLDELLMGTPPPGRSALDKWQQRGEPEGSSREKWG